MSEQTIRNFPLSIVLSDPNGKDMPIVFANEAFTRTTGYTAEAAVGQNCRFLQGGGTDPDAVREIREALDAEREITVDILNYRADGEEFVNRLMIRPLFDEDGGKATYFLGIQTEKSDYTSFSERNAELDEQLRELQHRVKNHLALVLPMIRLEAKRACGDAEATFEVLSCRVETSSLLYEQFADAAHEGSDVIQRGAYHSRVCAATQGLTDPGRLLINFDMDEAETKADDAARIGLFLSGLLNNAIAHGFDAAEGGRTDVELRAADDRLGLRSPITDRTRAAPNGRATTT